MRVCWDLPQPDWQHLTAQQLWAVLHLLTLADLNGQVAGPIHRIAAAWQCSPRTVQRLLGELENRGWVKVQVLSGQSRIYQLCSPASSVITLEKDKTSVALSQNRLTREGTSLPSQKKRSSSDASRLLHQHADRYTARFSQPFPVAWARDTQIYKRLINTYGAETVDSLQARYLSQPLTSFAARRGFSVPQFAGEIAGLAAQHSVRQHLSEEQAQVCAELMTAGLAEATALTLVTTFSPANIRDQLDVHCWRQQQGLSASPKRLEQAIRGQWVVPDQCRRVEYPSFPASSRDTDNPEQDLTKIWPTFANHVFPLHPQ